MCVIDPVNYSKIAEDQGEYGQCSGARAPALHLRPGHTHTILKQLKTIYIEKNSLFLTIHVLDLPGTARIPRHDAHHGHQQECHHPGPGPFKMKRFA